MTDCDLHAPAYDIESNTQPQTVRGSVCEEDVIGGEREHDVQREENELLRRGIRREKSVWRYERMGKWEEECEP